MGGQIRTNLAEDHYTPREYRPNENNRGTKQVGKDTVLGDEGVEEREVVGAGN